MRIELLGAVTVRSEDGAVVTPTAPKRRALLATLAVQLGHVVPTELLIELVWEGAPPPTARAALQGHIAALRRLLDGGLVLTTRADGYLLAGAPDQVDSARFEQLCGEAGLLGVNRADPADAVALDLPDGDEDRVLPTLRAALDLWRGPALTDCGSTLLREQLAPLLTDLRLRALDRLAAGLARLGRGAELVAELTGAVSEHPSHQQLTVQLLTCLEQAGRREEALAWYDRAMARLPGAPGSALRLAGERLARSPRSPQGPGSTSPPAPAGPARAASPAAPRPPVAAPPVAAPTTTAPPVTPPPVTVPSAAAPPAARPSRPVPEQLPRGERRFVGRSTELDRLDAAVAVGREVRPILVSGPAGVGKTSLVRHWAHRVADRFPDGRLHADLRGFDPAGPRDPAEVLVGFLIALGVAESALPATLDDRARRYRELLAGRRLLIVLDNARSYRQLVPLLPDPAPEAPEDPDGGEAVAAPVAVVTSRSRLRDLLVHEGAVPLSLDVLPPADARELLARALDPARVAAEPQAAAELAEHCDRLPLALRLAVVRLAARPGWTLAELAAELADEPTRLAALAGGGHGSLGVAASLELTCRTLSPEAARLFTLLGLHPGTVIDPPTAAVLADLPPATARDLLGRLDAAHLMEESAPGRFARHDLVRLYAAQLADELPHQQRLAAMERLVGHYLAATAAARAALPADSLPPTDPEPVPVSAAAGLPSPVEAVRAADWFRREERAVRAAVCWAERQGRFAVAWQLAHQAAALYRATAAPQGRATAAQQTAGPGDPEWRATVEAGLRAARAAADQGAVARLHLDLAVLLLDQRQLPAALEQLGRALAEADRLSDPVLRHRCRVRSAALLLRARAGDRAVPLLTVIVAGARTLGDPLLLAQALDGLANALVIAGAPGPALAHADEAVQLLAAHPDAAETVLATHTRAAVLYALGRPGAALATARLGLALGRAQGNRQAESRSYALIAVLLHALGRTTEALAAERRVDDGENGPATPGP